MFSSKQLNVSWCFILYFIAQVACELHSQQCYPMNYSRSDVHWPQNLGGIAQYQNNDVKTFWLNSNTPARLAVIWIRFLDTELFHDYLELLVSNGTSEMLFKLSGKQISTYVVTVPSSYTLAVLFTTDAKSTGKGFNITYIRNMDDSNLWGGYVQYPCCGSTNYSPASCSNWTISVRPGEFITLTFDRFDTASSDQLMFYDLNQGDLILTLSGSYEPGKQFHLPTHNALIIFTSTSEGSGQHTGFGMEYGAVCASPSLLPPAIIAASRGVIVSPRYPWAYPIGCAREYIVNIPEGFAGVQFTYDLFETEVFSDTFQIKSTDKKILAQHSGELTTGYTEVIKASGYVTVSFCATYHHYLSYKGFVVYWKVVLSELSSQNILKIVSDSPSTDKEQEQLNPLQATAIAAIVLGAIMLIVATILISRWENRNLLQVVCERCCKRSLNASQFALPPSECTCRAATSSQCLYHERLTAAVSTAVASSLDALNDTPPPYYSVSFAPSLPGAENGIISEQLPVPSGLAANAASEPLPANAANEPLRTPPLTLAAMRAGSEH